MKLALYNYWRSSSSWRVRIALGLKQLEWQYRPVNLVREGGEQYRPDHLARNPAAHIPVLEITFDDGPEPRVAHLGQSLAILEFLEEEFPEPAILPLEPLLRAHCRQLAEQVNSSIQPFQNLSTLKAVRQSSENPDEAQRAWLHHFLGGGLAALEGLTARHAGRFSVGDSPTIADCCLIPQLYSARRYEVDLAPFPTLLAVEAECNVLPAFQAAHADHQPDAPRIP